MTKVSNPGRAVISTVTPSAYYSEIEARGGHSRPLGHEAGEL